MQKIINFGHITKENIKKKKIKIGCKFLFISTLLKGGLSPSKNLVYYL